LEVSEVGSALNAYPKPTKAGGWGVSEWGDEREELGR
jgi:hypothetical protein